jgi:hypothetical protein
VRRAWINAHHAATAGAPTSDAVLSCRASRATSTAVVAVRLWVNANARTSHHRCCAAATRTTGARLAALAHRTHRAAATTVGTVGLHVDTASTAAHLPSATHHHHARASARIAGLSVCTHVAAASAVEVACLCVDTAVVAVCRGRGAVATAVHSNASAIGQHP